MTQEIITQISETVGTEVFGIWFLIGAAFVFFMQAGFAMVETGFTRAKNAGNIIMKNLMDFCIGTVVFIFLGFGLLLGEDALGGFIGLPTLGIFTDYANFDWSNLGASLASSITGLILYSTLSSVQQRQRLYQERWLKEQNSFPIVSTQE